MRVLLNPLHIDLLMLPAITTGVISEGNDGDHALTPGIYYGNSWPIEYQNNIVIVVKAGTYCVSQISITCASASNTLVKIRSIYTYSVPNFVGVAWKTVSLT